MLDGRNLSVDSFDSAEEDLPPPGLDSTSALVLVPDDEDESPFNRFSSDDEEEELDLSEIDWLSSSTTSLSSTVVFIYLLTPFLSLGALFVPDGSIPLKYGIPAVCVFAILSAFSRYIWYMLARYVRKTTTEDIVLNAFARTHRKEGRRTLIKLFVKLGDGLLRTLLATTFLRTSVDVLCPISPPKLLLLPSRVVLTAILSLAVLPMSLPQSFSSKRIIIPTALSLLTYIAWLVTTAYSHATGTLDASAGWHRMGTLWEGITAIAFAFTASSTVSLYGSLKANHQNLRRKSAPRSFRILLIGSAVLAVGLIVPSLFFVSSPNDPHAAHVPPKPLRACLHAATLVLTIPSVLVRSPNIPMPHIIRRWTSTSYIPISRCVTYIFVILLSFVPVSVFSVLSDVSLVLALLGTYLLPACIHVIIHNFRKPLSIIMPPQTPSLDGPGRPSDTLGDELLQRKEQTLQRRRLYRRLVWDLGVWILVLPVGGGGTVWAVGRLLSKW